jgi:hypothetical protein
MLEPHASQFVDTGPSWFGATNHYLALLASTLDRPDEADARFADAASAYERLGADAWLVRVWIDWSRTLMTRRGARDMCQSRRLLRQARDAARTLGLPAVERRAATLAAELDA